jgi:hypothetical protein
MTAIARIWITALYDQDDSHSIAAEATNMARAEEHLDAAGVVYSRQRLQNGTVDLSFDVSLDDAIDALRGLRSAGVSYGTIDIEGTSESDPRIDALESFDPQVIISVEV